MIPPVTLRERALWIAGHDDVRATLSSGVFSTPCEMPLVEALVLGLLKQGVKKYFVVFGHGSTALGEVLRVYSEAGLVDCYSFRNEIAMAHAATTMRWAYGECVAVVTSIGPGALQAMAASLTAASNGVGIYHIYGDETSYGEGYNMQQIPKPTQGLFGQMTALMGASYTLHTPGALREALRQGVNRVFHPYKVGPFFLLLPLNTQWENLGIRIDTLPDRPQKTALVPACSGCFEEAAKLLHSQKRIAIKIGGGARHCPQEVLCAFVENTHGVAVLSPGSTGALPDEHMQNLHVGGAKGSISGNWAMQHAELLVVIGSRAVCQSDCSGTGWPRVRKVININADVNDLRHYHHTLCLQGDVGAVLGALNERFNGSRVKKRSTWLKEGQQVKRTWKTFIKSQTQAMPLFDAVWGRKVLTQPQAIGEVIAFCKTNNALKFFDAGDVQANGFQLVEDTTFGQSITDSGASYMGFAVSSLAAAGVAGDRRYAVAFTGDGSFMMNPQVLIDAVEHRAHALIVLFDNRRMAAISSLQTAQFQNDFKTNDGVVVDYVQLANSVQGVKGFFGGYSRDELRHSLASAYKHKGLSLIHVPVYYGDSPLGGMGVYGEWNVGNWCQDMQKKYLKAFI